jgi:long-chain acyl-CoA synthetase
MSSFSRPWLAHYDDGVPPSLEPYPERTLLDDLAQTARESPQHPVVLFEGARLTASRLERLSNAFAAALVRLGVRAGDRVALLLPNCPQFLIAELGAWKAGAIVAPLGTHYSEEELGAMLARIEADAVVTLTPHYARVKAVQDDAGVRHVIATSIKEHIPALRRAAFTLLRERRGGHRIALAPSDWWMRDLIELHLEAMRPDIAVAPGDAATLLPSGGTTGTPKAVLGTHQNLVISAAQGAAWYAGTLERGDVMLLPLPLSQVYGLSIVQPVALAMRLTLALLPDARDTEALVSAIRRVRPAAMSGVPALYAALLEHPKVRAGKVDLSCLKVCHSGAAALPADLKRRFEARAGCRLIEGYGMTESQAANAAGPLRGENRPGSVGLPLPDNEIRIVDAETGSRELPPGEVGEIVLHCPQHMSGYWGNADETAAALWYDERGRGWLRTGDLGRMDADGYLYLVDRKKDLIKVGGFQVWPRAIEEVIAAHPAVAEVGVAAVHDAEQGEVAKAWIVPRAGHRVTAEEIREHCASRLARHEVPALITVCDELPKSPVGKVLRRKLVERHAAESSARGPMRDAAREGGRSAASSATTPAPPPESRISGP